MTIMNLTFLMPLVLSSLSANLTLNVCCLSLKNGCIFQWCPSRLQIVPRQDHDTHHMPSDRIIYNCRSTLCTAWILKNIDKRNLLLVLWKQSRCLLYLCSDSSRLQFFQFAVQKLSKGANGNLSHQGNLFDSYSILNAEKDHSISNTRPYQDTTLRFSV